MMTDDVYFVELLVSSEVFIQTHEIPITRSPVKSLSRREIALDQIRSKGIVSYAVNRRDSRVRRIYNSK